jgi:hypothetical protein
MLNRIRTIPASLCTVTDSAQQMPRDCSFQATATSSIIFPVHRLTIRETFDASSLMMRASLNSPQKDMVCVSSAGWCMFNVVLYGPGSTPCPMPLCAENVLPSLTALANVRAVPQDTSPHGSTSRQVSTRQYLKTRHHRPVPQDTTPHVST